MYHTFDPAICYLFVGHFPEGHGLEHPTDPLTFCTSKLMATHVPAPLSMDNAPDTSVNTTENAPNESDTQVSGDVCYICNAAEKLSEGNTEWPSVWSTEQWQGKELAYPRLFEYCRDANSLGPLTQTGMALSRQRCGGYIDEGGNVKSSTWLNSLRNKIRKHLTSVAHSLACEIRRNKAQAVIEETFAAQNVKAEHSIECVFCKAYYVAKCNRPFTDHESLIDLQQLNGVDLGTILHSRYTATNIVNHIADEMRK